VDSIDLVVPDHLLLGAGDEGPEAAEATVWGTADELVMLFYGRISPESLRIEGDRGIVDQLHT
jgi:hypothetical protein